MTIAVAPFGLNAWPTPRRTVSACSWIALSIVSLMSRPGVDGLTSTMLTGWPIASLTTRRVPSVPCSLRSRSCSIPARP